MTPPSPAAGATCAVLAFNGRNQLAVPAVAGPTLSGVISPRGITSGGEGTPGDRIGPAGLAFTGTDPAAATAALTATFPQHTRPAEYYTVATPVGPVRVFLTQVGSSAAPAGLRFLPLDRLESDPVLAAVLAGLGPFLAEVPYLELGESDFIYRFRPAHERNDAIYGQDQSARDLYQSRLCGAIKAIARVHERSAGPAVPLDFGAVQYVIPSHFGFCLGVKNAIERAYETLAEQPNRRVFMLSELIHNPFVNHDLRRRGLRYLQNDKGAAFGPDGGVAGPGQPQLWDELTPEDVVIIPAFGATDEDKARLVRKGLALRQYDATCMLVEKVWRAARAYGREGCTIVIHGKHEHEETKATFSHTRRHAHAVIVRNLAEAKELGALIGGGDASARSAFLAKFAGRFTPGFDPSRHLDRLAVVNQTTLLMNETVEIIDYFRELYRAQFGDAGRVGGGVKRDTLCYATQVNQDALARALELPLDAALVVGGRNSSNTYQLYRLCAQKLGDRAHYLTSEADIRPGGIVRHYHFGRDGADGAEERALFGATSTHGPRRILVTGGASCPDGIIQQVIDRLNGAFPSDQLRPVEAVLADLERVA
jgi:4-hydroxy-3-methylbut-2-enyl diphosphate reductase